MAQGFGIKTLMGSIATVAMDRKVLEEVMEENPLLSLGSEIVELEINTDPVTDKGLEIQEEIKRVWAERKLLNFRFDKGPKWYAMSPDERYQFILDMLTLKEEDMTPVDFGDRTDV